MITSHIDHLSHYRIYLQVVHEIRRYLDSREYLELDLPVMVSELIPESYLEVYETEYRYFDERRKLYLTPSPELLIKRLLVDGIGDCYYLGRSYRNSEPPGSSRHLGEFMMLEMYRVGASYMDIAEEVLKLLQNIKYQISHTKDNTLISYKGLTIDLSRWEKMTVAEAFERYAAISPEELFDHEKFRAAAQRKGYVTEMKNEKLKIKNDQGRIESQSQDDSQLPIANYQFTYSDLWSQIYTAEVEPELGCHGYPTLLYDYPVEFAALSKPNSDGLTAQRFEFYIAGLELGNCYSELTDSTLQRARLAAEQQERIASGKISHPVDVGFVAALERGMPECSGIAIGVDRLAMVYAGVEDISRLKLISVSHG